MIGRRGTQSIFNKKNSVNEASTCTVTFGILDTANLHMCKLEKILSEKNNTIKKEEA